MEKGSFRDTAGFFGVLLQSSVESGLVNTQESGCKPLLPSGPVLQDVEGVCLLDLLKRARCSRGTDLAWFGDGEIIGCNSGGWWNGHSEFRQIINGDLSAFGHYAEPLHDVF